MLWEHEPTGEKLTKLFETFRDRQYENKLATVLKKNFLRHLYGEDLLLIYK